MIVKSKVTALLPSVQYGNIQLEAGIEFNTETDCQNVRFEDGSPLSSVTIEKFQQMANKYVLDSLKEQKKEIDKLERGFFKVNL